MKTKADVELPSYVPTALFQSGHIDTLLPFLFRRVPPVAYRRERIDTDDGDFLDLDWGPKFDGSSLVIFSHGLEGSSRAGYIQGMIQQFSVREFATLAWNFRSCGGEINKADGFYHSGASEDLAQVVTHALKRGFAKIHLVGFSMGGNMVLKYLGECADTIDRRVTSAVVFSVPCDLQSSAERLAQGVGRFYTRRFVSTLSRKLELKRSQLEGRGIDLRGSRWISDFKTWDERFTAPLHGFEGAVDYWTRSSSRPFIPSIRVPTLIVNALNDPFLGQGCFPYKECAENPFVRLETPATGGHVGFAPANRSAPYWSEEVALKWIGDFSE